MSNQVIIQVTIEQVLDSATEEETEELLRAVLERVPPAAVKELTREYYQDLREKEAQYWEDYKTVDI